MKVVHIVSSVTGGAGIAALRLHRSLLKIEGVESYIIHQRDTTDDLSKENVSTLYESQSLLYRLRRKLGITPERKQFKMIPTYSSSYEYEIATFPTSSYRIEDHPLVKDADIVHLHWVANFLNYPTFFNKVKCPIVWTLHDKNAFHGLFHTETDERNNISKYGKLDNIIRKNKEKYLSKVTNLYIVTPSQWLLDKSIASNTFRNFSHICITNSIDINQCTISHTEAQDKLQIDNEKKTLLFIAHSIAIPRRGFYIMKDALNMIDHKLLNFNLITVGGDKIELGIEGINHIHYNSTHDIELLNTIYSAADLQILPTLEDNLPNVMLESFANGTPVISFANGGMAEHVETGKNGILVNTLDAESLKCAIEDFLNNKYVFDRNQIKEYAKEHFDENKIALQYLDLYKEILNK